MKPFQVFPLLLLMSFTEASALSYSKKGCLDSCGNVKIPYPFGIGANCFLNKWYAVDCNSSVPYLSALNNLEVLGVSLTYKSITVNSSMISGCLNPLSNSTQISSLDLDGSPFLFSMQNVLMVQGCGNAIILDHGSVLAGCSTTCLNKTISEKNTCFGVSCCQVGIPYYLKSHTLDFTRLPWLDNDGACESAFVVDPWFSGKYTVGDTSFVPVSLKWTVTAGDVKEADCSVSGMEEYYLGNGTSVLSSECFCSSSHEGNPYLRNGCKESEECNRCWKKGLSCGYDEFYGRLEKNFTCVGFDDTYTTYDLGSKSSSLGIILGVSISMGLLCLTAIIYALYKLIIKTKLKRRKEKFFKRNGGLLLKQQDGADKGLANKTIHFSSDELEKATDHFNENRILGRGGQGTVYKGMLTDGRIVAIKKSKVVDESQLEQFINEVVILSQVNHRNVVKLLGCCLETEVPLLVSEFISNGTLYDRIQDDTHDFPISLNMRLQIATEVAGALSYLHSATSIPIYHRDVKTTNILLDEKYRAKVSDFGTSRFVSIDQTHLTTLVKGTFGYLDPEYFQSSQFTEKSDVYSFGVVLVELLTGERPISLTRFGEHRSLATHFMLAMEEGRVMSIFDAIVIKEGSKEELMTVANLAMRCLNFNGKNRPTMKEVAIELEGIRMSHVPQIVQPNVGQVKYDEELLMLTYGESMSTTMSFIDNIDQ